MKFVIEGRPQGKARARTFWNSRMGKMQSITPEQTKSYEDLVRWSYKAAGGYISRQRAVYGGYKSDIRGSRVLSQEEARSGSTGRNTALREA